MMSEVWMEMIEKEMLIKEHSCTLEVADALLEMKRRKQHNYQRDLTSIFKEWDKIENAFHPIFQQEMTTVWVKGEWKEVPKAWWEQRKAALEAQKCAR
jgi:hypothetical protein